MCWWVVVFGFTWSMGCVGPLHQYTVDTTDVIGHASRLMSGCGLESINHELEGVLDAQMIFGESFEEPRNPYSNGTTAPWQLLPGSGSCRLNYSEPWQGKAGQWLYPGQGVVNYGLSQNHRWGMYLQKGKEYKGRVFLRAPNKCNILLYLRGPMVEPMEPEPVYAQVNLTVQGADVWMEYNFTLTPNVTTGCSAGADRQVTCGGAFAIRSWSCEVTVDTVYLKPADWGTVAGTSRRDVAEQFVNAGFSFLRFGGSMCLVDGYRWKEFRGQRPLRVPYTSEWYHCTGCATRGWGIFEFLHMTEALHLTSVITLNSHEDPEDLADLMEYLYGNDTTLWGYMRGADGHPAPFDLHFIEIGNEQPPDERYLIHFLDAVQAMEGRADSLRIPISRRPTYAIGINLYPVFFTENKTKDIIERAVSSTNYLKDRIVWDTHIADGIGNNTWVQLVLDSLRDIVNNSGSQMRAVVWEENGGSHDVARAVGHSINGNLLLSYGGFVHMQGTANCLQAYQQTERNNGWDQGVIFALPNMSWGQPAFYSSRMMNQSALPDILRIVPKNDWAKPLTILALGGGDRVVIRVANSNHTTACLRIHLEHCTPASTHATLDLLQGPEKADHRPGYPARYTPVRSLVPIHITWNYTVPPWSFSVLTVLCRKR